MHYDLLVKIKNAERARKESFLTPFSELNFSIARILADAKYIESVQKREIGKKKFLEVKLAYRTKNQEPALTDFKIMSKPGRRLYIGYRDLQPVKQNYGVAVLSTPQGIMTNRDARKNKVGGEYLFQVW